VTDLYFLHIESDVHRLPAQEAQQQDGVVEPEWVCSAESQDHEEKLGDRNVSPKDVEYVLAAPTAVFHDLGLFQGFSSEVERYLPQLLQPAHLRYLPRPEAENDPSHKQLIPYIVLRWGDQIFHYRRGKAGGEVRLQARRSIGVGGHINREDGDLADAYRQGLLREVREEVELEGPYQERIIGLINDDRTPVGQVHLGIVHLFDLAGPNVRRREAALTDDGFAPLAELRRQSDQFETWSQFLLEGPWLA
jgi:predicted NUDIX family phosphoesterase